MGDGYNFKTLKEQILQRSRSQDWEIAKLEWVLIDINESDEDETCLCGHHPIREICTIRNSVTATATDVGNVCVKRFLGIRSDLVFSGLKRIRKDETKSLNAECIAFFYSKRIINEWEYNFSSSTKSKRLLTQPQMLIRIRINRKIIAAIGARGLPGGAN